MGKRMSVGLFFIVVAVFALAGHAVDAFLSNNPAVDDSSSGEIAEAQHLQDSESVYADQDDDGVVTMYLTVSTGSQSNGTNHTWAEVNEYSAYDYEEMGIDKYAVEGLLQVGDENGPAEGELGYGAADPNAKVTIRGHSSSLNPQKSYKIKIDKKQGTWRGQRVINLNKHPYDGLHFRNKLGFSMLRAIPQLTSLRTQFVHLYVRDTTEGGSGSFEDYGLYTQVEELNEQALQAHGLDDDGWLYKVNSFEFRRYADAIKTADDPDYDEDTFEEYLEIEGNDDHSKLIDMLDAVNDESIPIEQVISEHFDEQNLTYWLAFNLLTGNVDTENQNFYLYSPTDSDTWYILSWDLDGFMFYDESRIEGPSAYASWERGVSNYWGNVLMQRCLKSGTFRDDLQAAIDDIRQNYLTDRAVADLVDEYRTVVEPFVYADDAKWTPLSEEEYDEVANGLPGLIGFYYDNYRESLARPMPFFIGTPQVENGKLVVNWGASYDFDGEALTYTATVARDPEMTDVVCSYAGSDLSAVFDDPGEGRYYLKVTVANASGETQEAFDSIRLDDGTHAYGELAFTIGADGTVTRA